MIEETWSRVAAIADASISERIGVEFELELWSIDYMDDQYENPSWFEFIVRGDVGLWDNWSALVDVRNISYMDMMSYESNGEGGNTRIYSDEAFLAPYAALVYSPRENVEVRVGYGVNPTNYADTPVEGRANGRERWISEYLWEHSGHDVLDAEEALADARTIGVMAVITF